MVRRKKSNFSFFLWHRRFGLAAIILIIVLSITGIMLNHTASMKLDSSYVDNAFILNWYGLQPEGEPLSFKTGDHRISQWGNQVFYDSKAITDSEQELRGAVQLEQLTIAAFDNELILFSNKGELVDRMPTTGRFADTRRIGIKTHLPIIETRDASFYITDENILDWTRTDDDNITWSNASVLTDEEREKLLMTYRGKGLTLERIVLDLHSGRIFGQFGVYLMDAAAFSLLWLSLSGFWIWWQRNGKLKQKKHYQKHHRG